MDRNGMLYEKLTFRTIVTVKQVDFLGINVALFISFWSKRVRQIIGRNLV